MDSSAASPPGQLLSEFLQQQQILAEAAHERLQRSAALGSAPVLAAGVPLSTQTQISGLSRAPELSLPPPLELSLPPALNLQPALMQAPALTLSLFSEHMLPQQAQHSQQQQQQQKMCRSSQEDASDIPRLVLGQERLLRLCPDSVEPQVRPEGAQLLQEPGQGLQPGPL